MADNIAQLYVDFAAKGLDKVKKGLDALHGQMQQGERDAQRMKRLLNKLSERENQNGGLTASELTRRDKLEKMLVKQERSLRGMHKVQTKMNKEVRDRGELLNKNRDRLRSVSEGFRGLTEMAAKARNVFGLAAGGIMGLLSQADPVRFKMLGASLSILALHMGRIFIPILKDAIAFVDRLANKFKNMTDEQKQKIVSSLMPAWKMITGAVEKVVDMFTHPERFAEFWEGIKKGALAIASFLKGFIEGFIGTAKKLAEWLGLTGDGAQGAAEKLGNLAGMAAALSPLLGVLGNLSKIVGGLGSALSLLGGSGGGLALARLGFMALTSPIGMVVAGIATIGIAIWKMEDDIAKATKKATDHFNHMKKEVEEGRVEKALNEEDIEQTAKEAAFTAKGTGSERRFMLSNEEKMAGQKHRQEGISTALQRRGVEKEEADLMAARIAMRHVKMFQQANNLNKKQQESLAEDIQNELEDYQQRGGPAKKKEADARRAQTQAEQKKKSQKEQQIRERKERENTPEGKAEAAERNQRLGDAWDRAKSGLINLIGGAMQPTPDLGGKKPWLGEKSHKEVLAHLAGGKATLTTAAPGKGKAQGEAQLRGIGSLAAPTGGDFDPLMMGRKPELLDVMEVWRHAQTADNNNPILRYQKELLNTAKGIKDAVEKKDEQEQMPRGLRR